MNFFNTAKLCAKKRVLCMFITVMTINFCGIENANAAANTPIPPQVQDTTFMPAGSRVSPYCTRPGYIIDPNSGSVFYYCHQVSLTEYVAFQFCCLNGTYYCPEMAVCGTPETHPNCTFTNMDVPHCEDLVKQDKCPPADWVIWSDNVMWRFKSGLNIVTGECDGSGYFYLTDHIEYSCKYGYYGNGQSCVACPEDSTGAQTSTPLENINIESCHVPTTNIMSNSKGQFHYSENCHYSP